MKDENNGLRTLKGTKDKEEKKVEGGNKLHQEGNRQNMKFFRWMVREEEMVTVRHPGYCGYEISMVKLRGIHMATSC